MNFDEIVSFFQEKSSGVESFGGKICLNVEGEGSIMLDGSGDSVLVTTSDDEADTTVGLSLETLQNLLSGDLNPAMAFMSGKLQVGGNMGLAMKLQGMLGEE